MAVLITTTVSVDTQKSADQVTMHLVKGDVGTRRFLFVPASGGRPVSMENVVHARVLALNQWLGEPLQIECVIESGKVYMTPTAALVADANEWACQLVLLDEDDQQLSSLPFTIIVHDKVFDGDAVEHTNTTVTAVYYDDDGFLCIRLADGTILKADRALNDHTHAIVTETDDGFFSHEWYEELQNWLTWLDQDVSTTAAPTFHDLHVGQVTIHNNGEVEGLMFV
jgi:hypothetical protein